MEHPGERNSFPNMLQPADPRHGPFNTHAKTSVWHAAGATLTSGSGISGLSSGLIHSVTATGRYSTNGETLIKAVPLASATLSHDMAGTSGSVGAFTGIDFADFPYLHSLVDQS